LVVLSVKTWICLTHWSHCSFCEESLASGDIWLQVIGLLYIICLSLACWHVTQTRMADGMNYRNLGSAVVDTRPRSRATCSADEVRRCQAGVAASWLCNNLNKFNELANCHVQEHGFRHPTFPRCPAVLSTHSIETHRTGQ
jgi:hypothetical protein